MASKSTKRKRDAAYDAWCKMRGLRVSGDRIYPRGWRNNGYNDHTWWEEICLRPWGCGKFMPQYTTHQHPYACLSCAHEPTCKHVHARFMQGKFLAKYILLDKINTAIADEAPVQHDEEVDTILGRSESHDG